MHSASIEIVFSSQIDMNVTIMVCTFIQAPVHFDTSYCILPPINTTKH